MNRRLREFAFGWLADAFRRGAHEAKAAPYVRPHPIWWYRQSLRFERWSGRDE